MATKHRRDDLADTGPGLTGDMLEVSEHDLVEGLRHKKSKVQKTSSSTPIIIGSVVLAAALMGGAVWTLSSPESAAPVVTPEPAPKVAEATPPVEAKKPVEEKKDAPKPTPIAPAKAPDQAKAAVAPPAPPAKVEPAPAAPKPAVAKKKKRRRKRKKRDDRALDAAMDRLLDP